MNNQPQNSVTVRDAATREILAVVQVGSRANMEYGGDGVRTTVREMLRTDWGRLTNWAEGQQDRDRAVIVTDEYVY